MMARMEMVTKLIFLKLFRMNFFQIALKFCKNVVAYEIPSGNCFYHFVRVLLTCFSMN